MNFSLISPTAYHVAFVRGRSSIPYAREIADACNAEAQTKLFFATGGYHFKTSWAMMQHAMVLRFYSTLAAVRSTYIANVLELASGVSPLGLVVSDTPHMHYTETDLPSMVATKMSLITQLGLSRSNLHHTPVNVCAAEDYVRATKCLQTKKPICVVCEGLLMYLSPHERSLLMHNVRTLLTRTGGMWVTPDITVRSHVLSGKNRSQDSEAMYRAYMHGIGGRDTSAYAYLSYEAAESELTQHGFTVSWGTQISLAPTCVPKEIMSHSTYLQSVRMATLRVR